MRIALVTSRGTAALQDMLKVLRRFPWLRLALFHVPVQGDGAAQQIAHALDTLSRQAADVGGIDLILLARGGGSLEDLWAFNEECVARAMAASTIPIITGIGHEIDVSIADLVADYHAHTPTEAAPRACSARCGRSWRRRNIVSTRPRDTRCSAARSIALTPRG
jgi:exodeoxyribonuclease VII large subunit